MDICGIEEHKLPVEEEHGQKADLQALLHFSEQLEVLEPCVVVGDGLNAGWTAASPQPRYLQITKSRNKTRQKDNNNYDAPWSRLMHTCPFSGVEKLRLTVNDDYVYRPQNGEYRAAKHRQRQVKLAREKNVPLTVEQRLLQRDIRRELRGTTRLDRGTDPIELRDYKLAGPSGVRDSLVADVKSDADERLSHATDIRNTSQTTDIRNTSQTTDIRNTSHATDIRNTSQTASYSSESNRLAAPSPSSPSLPSSHIPQPTREYTFKGKELWKKSESETDHRSQNPSLASPIQLPPIIKPVTMPHRKEKASVSLTEVDNVDLKPIDSNLEHTQLEADDRVKTPASLPATRTGENDFSLTSTRIGVRYGSHSRAIRTQGERFRDRHSNRLVPRKEAPKDFLSVVSNEASFRQPINVKETKAPSARVEIRSDDIAIAMKKKLNQDEIAASILEHLQEALTASQVNGPEGAVNRSPNLLGASNEPKPKLESTLSRTNRRDRHRAREPGLDVFLPNLTGKKMNMRIGSQRIL